MSVSPFLKAQRKCKKFNGYRTSVTPLRPWGTDSKFCMETLFSLYVYITRSHPRYIDKLIGRLIVDITFKLLNKRQEKYEAYLVTYYKELDLGSAYFLDRVHKAIKECTRMGNPWKGEQPPRVYNFFGNYVRH